MPRGVSFARGAGSEAEQRELGIGAVVAVARRRRRSRLAPMSRRSTLLTRPLSMKTAVLPASDHRRRGRLSCRCRRSGSPPDRPDCARSRGRPPHRHWRSPTAAVSPAPAPKRWARGESRAGLGGWCSLPPAAAGRAGGARRCASERHACHELEDGASAFALDFIFVEDAIGLVLDRW